ncbi:MAG: hypothetical protein JWM82_4027 [Myxococcales bacterium]|nr:hypothetical protein [Myxococcales bacterium]
MSRAALTTIFLLTTALSCHGRASTRSTMPAAPLGPVSAAKVFYFGHSLVGRDLPVMIGSFAKARGKTWMSQGQIGWGTSLRAHYEWDGAFDKNAPNGFARDSQGHPFFAGEGKAQLQTGRYDTLVLTDTAGFVHGNGDDTVNYATRLVKLARKANPTLRVFLYGTWLDRKEFPNEDAWRAQAESDIKWWERVADRVSEQVEGPPLFVIPGGPILARVTRAAAQGKLPGLTVNDFFRDNEGGVKDTIHLNDRGFYVMALAHYASIMRDSPVGLPVETQTEDGPAEALSPENAARVQGLVWDVLKAYPRAGVGP